MDPSGLQLEVPGLTFDAAASIYLPDLGTCTNEIQSAAKPKEYNFVSLEPNDPTQPFLDGEDDYYPENLDEFIDLLRGMKGNVAPGSTIAIHAHGDSKYFHFPGEGSIWIDDFAEIAGPEGFQFEGVTIEFRVCNFGLGLHPDDVYNLYKAMGEGKGNVIKGPEDAYYILPGGFEWGSPFSWNNLMMSG